MFITITVFFITHYSVEFVICPLTHRYQHAICVSYLENHFSEQPVKIKIGKIVSVEYQIQQRPTVETLPQTVLLFLAYYQLQNAQTFMRKNTVRDEFRDYFTIHLY